jgi:hypothetical protein
MNDAEKTQLNTLTAKVMAGDELSAAQMLLYQHLLSKDTTGKPPPSTSLLSSSSFHPLFDFIFLFNSHAILSLLGFSFPAIYL